jgi:hypothetical protein
MWRNASFCLPVRNSAVIPMEIAKTPAIVAGIRISSMSDKLPRPYHLLRFRLKCNEAASGTDNTGPTCQKPR